MFLSCVVQVCEVSMFIQGGLSIWSNHNCQCCLLINLYFDDELQIKLFNDLATKALLFSSIILLVSLQVFEDFSSGIPTYLNSQNVNIYQSLIQQQVMIQNLLEYYSLVRSRVFDHLTSLYSRKLHAQATYSRLLSQLAEEAATRLNELDHFAAGRAHFRPPLIAYAQVFAAVRDELQSEAREVDRVGQERQQGYLDVLEKCRVSHMQSQRGVIEAGKERLREEAGKMGERVREVEGRQGRIESLKGECFTRMLAMLNDFDEQLIRQKFAVQQSERSFKELGAKRREMNERLDEVAALEQQAKEIITSIRQAEQKRDVYCETICDKLAEIEMSKLQALQWTCLSFTKQFKPIEVRFSWLGLVERRAVQVGFVSSREFLENYKKTLYLLLNPHPQNQILIDHKQSLAHQLSLSALQEHRHGQTFELPPSLQLSLDLSEKDTTEGYNGYVEFIYRIRNTIASAYLSEEELTAFYDFFKSCVRRRPLREVFLFYLYELGKTPSSMMELVCKDGQAVVRMLNLFFSECLTLYDSQSAIKALMLLYHLRLPGTETLPALRHHPLWRSFQFWETSFLESVYEYFEVVVIYYHKLVESQAQQTGQSNWFTALFSIFPRKQPKQLSPHEALREFYHEIIQNMTVIYLANMLIMRVPHRTVDKFKAYITGSVARLNWTPELTLRLHSALSITSTKSEKNLQRLLTNEGILDRVMSKLLGSGEQEKSVPLSKAIADWLEER